MIDSDVHLAAIAAGDPEAFASWVAGAEPRIRLSLRQFAATVDTESVVQECLLRMWQVAPRVKPDGKTDCLLRLAVRTAHNLAITELRRRRPATEQLRNLPDPPAPSVPDYEPDDRLGESLEDCMTRLPPKPRQAMRERLRDPAKRDSILAKIVGMQLNTFVQNIRRARLALADCLRRHGIDLEFKP